MVTLSPAVRLRLFQPKNRPSSAGALLSNPYVAVPPLPLRRRPTPRCEDWSTRAHAPCPARSHCGSDRTSRTSDAPTRHSRPTTVLRQDIDSELLSDPYEVPLERRL